MKFNDFIKETFAGEKVDLVTVSLLQMGWNEGVKAEREACAELCETGISYDHPTVKDVVLENFGKSPALANAIRARGENDE